MKKYYTLLAFLSWLSFPAKTQTAGSLSANEEAIRSLLIKEVDALNKTQNIDDYMSCFAPSEDIIFGPNKNQLIKGATALKNFAEKIIVNYQKNPNKNTWTFSDWKIRINGNSAFVTCLQTTTTPVGSQIEVFKSDYLEKFNGQWKIVDHRFYHTPEIPSTKQ
jgi:ketosteroid isomerase-like protein